MIGLQQRDCPVSGLAYEIYFDEDALPKIIAFFERGLNTMSPPDPELLKVLDDMKGMK